MVQYFHLLGRNNIMFKHLNSQTERDDQREREREGRRKTEREERELLYLVVSGDTGRRRSCWALLDRKWDVCNRRLFSTHPRVVNTKVDF